MATYLQGVEPFIPDYQPFQPDFNFYGNLLQTKQNQYDTNWKHLNDIYGKYFYADVLRPSDIEKKDKLLKKIDFELRRVSGLDLSLEQNLTQATQVFRPFYEDKVLMHDVAYTKNFKNKRATGLALKNSMDPKQQDMYWNEGIEYMDILKDQYVNSSDEESLTMWAPEYTPRVKVLDHYTSMAKELGIEADVTTVGPSWIVRKRNGDLIYEPLVNIFKSEYSNNAAIQDMYRVEAVVNRERSIRQTMEKKGIDRTTAESEYISTQTKVIDEYLRRAGKIADKDVKSKNAQLEKARKNKERGKENLYTDKYINSLEESQAYAKSVWASILKTQEESRTKPDNTAIPRQGAMDLSLKQMAMKVDAGVAMMRANQDIQQAAYAYSMVDMLVDYEANPFAVVEARHSNRMKEIAEKNRLDKIEALNERRLASNLWLQDLNTGEIYPNPQFTKTKKTSDQVFTSPEAVNILSENNKAINDSWRVYGQPMYNAIGEFLASQVESGALHPTQYRELMHSYTYEPGEYKNPMQKAAELGIDFDDVVDRVSEYQWEGKTTFASYESPEWIALIKEVAEGEQLTGKDVRAEFNEQLYWFDDVMLKRLFENTYQLALTQRGEEAADHFLGQVLNSENDVTGGYLGYIQLLDTNEKITIKNRDAVKKRLLGSTSLDQFTRGLDVNPDIKSLIVDAAVSYNAGMNKEEDFVKETLSLMRDDEHDGHKHVSPGIYHHHDLKLYDLSHIRKGPGIGAGGSNERAGDWRSFTSHDNHNIDYMFDVEKPAFRKDFISKNGREPEQIDYINFKVRLKNAYGNQVNKFIKMRNNHGNHINGLYKDLQKIHAEQARNSKDLTSLVPVVMDKGKAVAQNAVIGKSVNLAAATGSGFNEFQEIVDVLHSQAINWDDYNAGNFVYLGGPFTKSNLENRLLSEHSGWFSNDTEGMAQQIKDDNDLGLRILRDLQSLVGSGQKGSQQKPKNMNITIGAASANVLSDFGTSGMAGVFIGDIDYSWLEDEYVKTEEGESVGLLTREQAKAIARDGIMFTTNRKNIEHTELYKTAAYDPYEYILNAGETIKYVDPYSAGMYEIYSNPNKSAGTPYVVEGFLQYLDDEGHWHQQNLGQTIPDDQYNLVAIGSSIALNLTAVNQQNIAMSKMLKSKGIAVDPIPELNSYK